MLEIFEVESDNIRSLPIPSTSNVTSYETRIRAIYEPFLPPEILSSLSTFQCGLCQQEMASLKVAWQHYTGKAHIRTVKSFLGRNYTIHPEKIDQPSYLADRHEWPGWQAGDHQSRAGLARRVAGPGRGWVEQMQQFCGTSLPRAVVASLTERHCGLCQLDIFCQPWSHYRGPGHRNTVELWREGNNRSHPPFPAMLHQYLGTVALPKTSSDIQSMLTLSMLTLVSR